MIQYPILFESGIPDQEEQEKAARWCREFKFRLHREKGHTFLTEYDIEWFGYKLHKKIYDDYTKGIAKPYKRLLQKYWIDNPDGKWDSYFYSDNKDDFAFADGAQITFRSIVVDDFALKTKKEFDSPKRRTNKTRILVEPDDVEILRRLWEAKANYSFEIARVRELKNSLHEVLSLEDLFTLFPGAKPLFAARDKEQEGKEQKRRTFEFIDGLLEKMV